MPRPRVGDAERVGHGRDVRGPISGQQHRDDAHCLQPRDRYRCIGPRGVAQREQRRESRGVTKRHH